MVEGVTSGTYSDISQGDAAGRTGAGAGPPGKAAQLAELVEAARRGRQYGWDGLVDRFAPLIRSIALRYGLKGQDADDIHQTVWLRLLEKIHDLREPNALPGWISTTSRNECVNAIRASVKVVCIEDWNTIHPARLQLMFDWDEELAQRERRHALFEAFSELSDIHRRLLTLLIQDPPLPYSEISEILCIPVGSIGPTRARALNRLRGSRSLVALGAA
ncbi:RNA polymerase sigma factor, partial [Streptomyces sp. NPDC059788]|uniref:RNA polymerase sigma factor n=1 Tax=Streptomyces sp. NPDC059788 TaxID=3346948 RepID=UPI0036471CE9